ncbi:MAG TPA: UTP--glucose-1-phosphate uridylyltransferase, partial [Opitutales bacterium]|nr:UTP--glucose-1-phosphate uridylyltransferase [Opitutales bacterium]
DAQAQKMRDSVRAALKRWAAETGEGSDYRDNLPGQCLHPVGHWYEVPGLLLNGTLQQLLAERPQLKTLLLHNIDTLGARLDPELLGRHLASGKVLNYELISRRVEDVGGGLARIDGRLRLVEGLALPREEDEFKLSYYNTLTTWIDIDGLLAAFGLTRGQLADATAVRRALRDFANRLPTYMTLKEVKKRWGRGQEDVFPVLQFERLWGDMSALEEIPTGYFHVDRLRGQQLKDAAQLDAWLRDGSHAYIDSLCEFSER